MIENVCDSIDSVVRTVIENEIVNTGFWQIAKVEKIFVIEENKKVDRQKNIYRVNMIYKVEKIFLAATNEKTIRKVDKEKNTFKVEKIYRVAVNETKNRRVAKPKILFFREIKRGETENFSIDKV